MCGIGFRGAGCVEALAAVNAGFDAWKPEARCSAAFLFYGRLRQFGAGSSTSRALAFNYSIVPATTSGCRLTCLRLMLFCTRQHGLRPSKSDVALMTNENFHLPPARPSLSALTQFSGTNTIGSPQGHTVHQLIVHSLSWSLDLSSVFKYAMDLRKAPSHSSSC